MKNLHELIAEAEQKSGPGADPLLRLNKALHFMGLNYATYYAMAEKGSAPPHTRVSKRTILVSAREVALFVAAPLAYRTWQKVSPDSSSQELIPGL